MKGVGLKAGSGEIVLVYSVRSRVRSELLEARKQWTRPPSLQFRLQNRAVPVLLQQSLKMGPQQLAWIHQ